MGYAWVAEDELFLNQRKVKSFQDQISTKVWDQAVIALSAPVSAVRHASAIRYVIVCAARPLKSTVTRDECLFWIEQSKQY